jgi:hypothetical protein
MIIQLQNYEKPDLLRTNASVSLSNTIRCTVALIFARFNVGLSEKTGMRRIMLSLECGPVQATAVKLGRHRQKIRYSKGE